MKITVELNTVEEMEQFLQAWKAKKEGFDLKPMPMTESITPAIIPNAASKQQPAPQQAEAPTPAASKQQPDPEEKALSIEDVTKVAVKLMDTGRQDDLRQLLVKYGVQALPELKDKPDKLAAFYAELEVM